jgi:hypothetical protein
MTLGTSFDLVNTKDDSEAAINVLKDMCSLCVIERKQCKMLVSLVFFLLYFIWKRGIEV